MKSFLNTLLNLALLLIFVVVVASLLIYRFGGA